VSDSTQKTQSKLDFGQDDVKEKKQRRKRAGKALTDVSLPDVSVELHAKETDESFKEQNTKSAEIAPSDSALVSETKGKRTRATKRKVRFSWVYSVLKFMFLLYKDSAAGIQHAESDGFPNALAAAISADGNLNPFRLCLSVLNQDIQPMRITLTHS
jgi:hypothetical protein